MSRVWVTVALVSVGLVALCSPASAGGKGGVRADDDKARPSPPSAPVPTEAPKTTAAIDGAGKINGGVSAGGSSKPPTPNAGGSTPAQQTSAVTPSPVSCRYHTVTSYSGNADAHQPLAGGQVDNPTVGSQVYRICTNTVTGAVTSREIVTIGAPAPPPDPAVVARALAEQAFVQISPSAPSVHANPPNGRLIINIPTWLWVDGWEPLTATAAAAGVSVTVTATPVRVRWDMGDGNTQVCHGPGKAWDPKFDARTAVSPCQYTYWQKAGAMTINATQTWRATYTATNGQSGFLGEVTRQSAMPVRVIELVTNIRPG